MASNVNLSLSEDNSSGTNLSDILTENEEQIDTTNWTPAKRKKLQHMKDFHEEYQQKFGEKASIRTIIKNRISNMNPPMPESVCREEMQSATQDNDVIEYITDAQGRKIKKLTPILVKAEPDREYTQCFHSDNELPKIPEEHFTEEREVTIASYSETLESVCKEEMQSATQDNDVVIEYITDAQGRKIKKLTPILVKAEPDREYTQHFHSDNELPKIPEEHFTEEREVTIASYSETLSSELSSEDRTLTAETENTSSTMEEHGPYRRRIMYKRK